MEHKLVKVVELKLTEDEFVKLFKVVQAASDNEPMYVDELQEKAKQVAAMLIPAYNELYR